MPVRRRGRAVVAVATCLCSAGPVLAQGRPPRGVDVLLATVTMRGSADGTLSSATDAAGRAANGDAQVMLVYRPQWRAASVQVGGTTGLRYLGARDELLPIGHTVGATVGVPIGRRTMVQGMANAGYIPTFSLAGAPSIPIETLMENPGLLPSVTIDYSLVRRAMYRSGVSLNANHAFTRRTSLTVGLNVDRSTFTDKADPSMGSLNASVRLSQRLTRYFGVRAGYARRQASVTQFGTPGASPAGVVTNGTTAAVPGVTSTPLVVEDLDIGVDFAQAKALRLSRRATLNFSTGSSFAQVDRRPRRFGVTVQSSLAYLVSASTNATVNYSRGVQLVPGVSRPVFADAVSVNGSQQVGRRMTLQAATNYSLGNASDTVQGSGRISNLSGSAQAGYLFSQRGRFSLDYLVARHRLGSGVDVVQGVPRYQFRHSVRATVTYAVPLVRDMSPRAGR